MNSLVANVLNRALGTWVKGLDPQSLQLSIYRGEVQLGPIELRPETITGLGFPITLISATVERISLTIPWTSLIFSPWTIEISGVRIEVETTPEAVAMDKKREVEMFFEAKQRTMEQFEMLPEEDVATEPGFAMKMATRVIDNLQLSISDVNIKVNHPLAHTSFALSFDRLAVLTCNSSWNPEYISGADVVNKIVSVDELSVTFTSQELGQVSIVEPLDYLVKAELNRTRENYPRLKMDLVLGADKKQVRINLRPEFVVGLKELNLFFAHYREFRAGVLSQQQLRDIDPSEFDAYQGLYTAWKQSPKQPADNLLAFERDKTTDSLIAQRKLAKNRQSLANTIAEKEAQIQAIMAPQTSRLSRLAGWLSLSSAPTELEKGAKVEELKREIKDLSQKQSLLAKEFNLFIGEKNKKVDENDANAIGFAMERFQLAFFSKSSEVLLLSMSGLKANLSYSSTDMSFFIGHKEISLKQNLTPDSVFPFVGLFTNLRSSYQYESGLHKVVYTAKESYLVYDAKVVQYFIGILNDITPKNIDVEGYSRQISAKTLKYVRLGRQSVESITGDRAAARFNVMVMAQAPHFLFPLSATGQCLYLDLGYVKAKTKAQAEHNLHLFDEFEVDLEHSTLELWERALSPKEPIDGRKETIVTPFSISSKVRKAVSKDSLVAFASETIVQPIEINLSDTFLKFVFALLGEVKHIWADLTPAESIANVAQNTAYELGQNLQIAIQSRQSASPCNLKGHLERMQITLIKEEQPFRRVLFESVSSVTTVDSRANMQHTFRLGAFTMTDPSAANWQQLLAPALPWQPDSSTSPHSFENVLQAELCSMQELEPALAMLEVRYSFEAMLNSTKIWMKTRPVTVSPNAESFRRLRVFLISCMEIHAEHAAKNAAKTEEFPHLPAEAGSSPSEYGRRAQLMSIFSITAEIGVIKLCIPESADVPDSRVLSLELELGVHYKLDKSTTVFFDTKGVVYHQESTQRKDEILVKIFELHSYFDSLARFTPGSPMEKPTDEIRDLLRPMRASLMYVCDYQSNVDDVTLEMQVEFVEASISYRDICSLQTIAASFQSIMGPGNTTASKPMQTNRLVKYDIDVKWETAIIGLVDDFRKNSTPVLKAVSSNFYFEMTLFQKFFLLKAGSAVEIRYFNTAVMEWELILEEVNWRVFALEPKDFIDAKSGSEPPKPIADFDFSIANVAKLNLSLSMLASVGDILKSVQQLMAAKKATHQISQKWDRDAEKVPQQRYVFHNQLGRDVQVILHNEKGEPVKWDLEKDAKKEVTKSAIEKELHIETNTAQRRFGGHYYELELPTTMTLRIEGKNVVENLRIDDTALHHFTVVNAVNYTFGGLIDKHNKGQQQIISLQSLLRLVNRTSVHLQVRANTDSALTLESDCSLLAPLVWTEPAKSLFLSAGEDWVEMSLVNNMELRPGFNVVVDEVDLEVKGTLEVLQVLIISTPMTVLNCLPYTVAGVFQDVKVVCEPGMTVKPVSIPYTSNPPKWKWELDLGNGQSAVTPKVPLKDGEQSYKLSGNISVDKFTLLCERNNFMGCLDFDLSEYAQVRAYYNSKMVTLYAPYILVNNTSFKLDFKAERTFLQVGPHASGFAVVEKPTFKVRLTGDEYGTTSSYSEKFNGSTVGLAGCLQAKHKDKIFEETPDLVRLGVTIEQAAWPLTHSKVIRIYPRFFVFNLSSADLKLQQDGSSQCFSFPHGCREPFHFPSDSNLLLHLSEDGVYWSTPFSVENIDSFQVVVRAEKQISREEEEEETPASEFNLDPLSLKPTRPHLMRFLDVFVSTANEAVIFIIIKNPLYPALLIQNLTDEMIEVWQLNCESRTSVLPMMSLPLALENLIESDPIIVLSTAGDIQPFSLSKEKVFTRHLADYEVSLFVNKITKVLKIAKSTRDKANRIAKNILGRVLLTRHDTNTENIVYDHFVFCKCNCFVKGIEISLIDGTPAELFVLTVDSISIKVVRQVVFGTYKDYAYELKAKVRSLQIDNMSDGKEEFPVLLSQRSSEKALFKLILETKSTFRVHSEDLRETPVSFQVRRLNLYLQEMMLQMHQDTLVHLLEVISQVSSHFQYKTEARSDEVYIKRAKDSVKEIMKTEMPGLELGDELSTKVFFELVDLGSIKLTISYRTVSKKRNLIISKNSSELTKFLDKIASAIVNISNSNLYFSSILLHKSFKSFQELLHGVVRNYVRQGALQFYRLLGASELIGNPLGLINKLGTGVFEFFDEPRKGLKNPGEFAKGVGRGVRSLVSSVVSGSMESVSQVTGSLYRIVSQDQSASRTGQFSHEFTGSVEGLAHGITGLVTKPIEGAKEGFGGFMKGVGSGVYGAVTAPVSMVLRVSSNVTSNIADVTTFTSVFQCERKRFPRYFGSRKRLLPYDRALAEAHEYWKTFSQPNEKEMFCIEVSSKVAVLLTNIRIVVLQNGQLRGSVENSEVQSLSVLKVKSEDVIQRFQFSIKTRRKLLTVTSTRFSVMGQLYEVLVSLLQPILEMNKDQGA